jgi:regulatory protein
MEITKIERMRSRKPRYRLRFDDGDPLIICEDVLASFALATGDTVSQEDIQRIVDAHEIATAKQSAYVYISYRPRSRREIVDYLLRKKYSKRWAEHTAAEFVRLGLVDDEAFAAMVIRDAVKRGRTGPSGIRNKLLQKGVHRDIIQSLLDEYFGEHLQERKAFELLERRVLRTRRSLEKLLPAQRRARLFQYLAQRGFSSQAARHALTRIEV